MIYYIDLFCGAGGVTTGIVRAKGKVIACINHDELAIKSHKSNHKNVLHFTEDIKTFNVSILGRLVRNIRKHDPHAVICLWASLECTHFSKAKGGSSRDADSRTLAEHLYRYVAEINPEYIDIENVVEFMSWGPLRVALEKSHKDRSDLKLVKSEKTREKQGHPYHMVPESRKKGTDYLKWYTRICEQYNYDYDYRVLNAADFGARTSRVRYFGQFKKRHLPFTWPDPTHAKDPSNGGIGKKLRKWKAVRPALNLDDKGRSIFGRKKDLSENTLKRLYAGLIKHVGDGQEPAFITKWMSGGMKNVDLNDPAVTITTMNHLGLVQPEFITKYMSNPRGGVSNPVDIDGPAPTVTTHGRLGVVQPEFVMKNFSGRPKGKVKSTDEPLGSITTFGGGSLAQVELLMEHYSKGKVMKPEDQPVGAILTKDKFSVVTSEFLSKYFSGGDHSQGTDKPAGALTTKDHHAAVFVTKYYGTGITHDIDKPVDTLTTKDRIGVVWVDREKVDNVEAMIINNYSNGGESGSIDSAAGAITTVPKANLASIESNYFLHNPQYQSVQQEINNKPCFTLIARMDKSPPYLIEAEKIEIEGYGILIYDDDSDTMKKIKLFMAIHGISDIKMRMLRVIELLRIQGFGGGYKLAGNQSDQKKFIGNSVPPELVRHYVRARKEALEKYFEIKMVA